MEFRDRAKVLGKVAITAGIIALIGFITNLIAPNTAFYCSSIAIIFLVTFDVLLGYNKRWVIMIFYLLITLGSGALLYLGYDSFEDTQNIIPFFLELAITLPLAAFCLFVCYKHIEKNCIFMTILTMVLSEATMLFCDKLGIIEGMNATIHWAFWLLYAFMSMFAQLAVANRLKREEQVRIALGSNRKPTSTPTYTYNEPKPSKPEPPAYTPKETDQYGRVKSDFGLEFYLSSVADKYEGYLYGEIMHGSVDLSISTYVYGSKVIFKFRIDNSLDGEYTASDVSRIQEQINDKLDSISDRLLDAASNEIDRLREKYYNFDEDYDLSCEMA